MPKLLEDVYWTWILIVLATSASLGERQMDAQDAATSFAGVLINGNDIGDAMP